MANCVTCGDELHPERAEKYDYCTRPSCQESNAKALELVAVGVNKAAEQFVLPTERPRKEMASGRYKKRPDAEGSGRLPRPAHRSQRSQPVRATRPYLPPARPRWSEAQENLTLIYRSMGMRPDQIAEKLGVSRTSSPRSSSPRHLTASPGPAGPSRSTH